MNKNGLVDRVAKEYQMSKQDTRAWVDAIFDVLGQAIVEDDVIIHNFGTFKHKSRAPRVGRDMSRGIPVYIPQRTCVQFELSDRLLTELKEKNNEKTSQSED